MTIIVLTMTIISRNNDEQSINNGILAADFQVVDRDMEDMERSREGGADEGGLIVGVGNPDEVAITVGDIDGAGQGTCSTRESAACTCMDVHGRV